MIKAKVVVIGDKLVAAKLLAAEPRILAHNRQMVTEMLNVIKPTVAAETPTGPGHFGYHLKDSYTTEVKSAGIKTQGVLKSPPTGYWYEFGTLALFRKGGAATAGMARAAFHGFVGHGGEPAHMLAHHALNGVRKMINTFYGGQAAWYRLP